MDLLKPALDAELFMSRTKYIELNKYMKSSASESIRNACFNLERLMQPFFSPSPAGNFAFGASLERRALIQTPNFSCTENI